MPLRMMFDEKTFICGFKLETFFKKILKLLGNQNLNTTSKFVLPQCVSRSPARLGIDAYRRLTHRDASSTIVTYAHTSRVNTVIEFQHCPIGFNFQDRLTSTCS